MHNLKRNGRRVQVLLHSKFQLYLISLEASFILNVFRPNLCKAEVIEETKLHIQ